MGVLKPLAAYGRSGRVVGQATTAPDKGTASTLDKDPPIMNKVSSTRKKKKAWLLIFQLELNYKAAVAATGFVC